MLLCSFQRELLTHGEFRFLSPSSITRMSCGDCAPAWLTRARRCRVRHEITVRVRVRSRKCIFPIRLFSINRHTHTHTFRSSKRVDSIPMCVFCVLLLLVFFSTPCECVHLLYSPFPQMRSYVAYALEDVCVCATCTVHVACNCQ